MKTTIIFALIIAAISALELMFGVDDTGSRVAFVIFYWSGAAIPIALVCRALSREIFDGM